MTRLFTARDAIVGMPLRQQALNKVPAVPDHKLTGKELISGGSNPNNDQYKITTNLGSWVFRWNELVTFPRRPDGSTKDWRGAAQPPLPLQLAVGDFLDTVTGPFEYHEAMSAEHNKMLYDSAYQRVTAITRAKTRPDVITVSTSSSYDGHRSWTFNLLEQVSFPRYRLPVGMHRPTGYNRLDPQLTGYGPYLYVEPDGDEYLIFYVTHPAGGGRWPSYLSNMIKIGRGVYLSKPPHAKGYWPPYVGERWERHPRDPHWELDTDFEIDRERFSAAIQAYTDYRARVGAE